MNSPRVPFNCHHEIPTMASVYTFKFRCFPAQQLELKPGIGWSLKFGRLSWNGGASKFVVRASGDSEIPNGSRSTVKDALQAVKGDISVKFQGIVSSVPPLDLALKRNSTASFTIGFCLATAMLFILGRISAARKTMQERPGSVADLVRRGQLRSDRRGISKPLKYEDPFNNPLVKVGKKNSTVEICGKVYRLAPVTLTKEEQAIHKRRRSRAYQWKRPTIFLKEGDTIPLDVDPDTVRWIPANHPFATTVNDIDEDLAQTNVYQKHGVPSRIKAEHEALQKKLEGLQRDEKLDNQMIDRSNAKDFERPYKFQPKTQGLENNSSSDNQAANTEPPKSKFDQRSSSSNSFPEEFQKP